MSSRPPLLSFHFYFRLGSRASIVDLICRFDLSPQFTFNPEWFDEEEEDEDEDDWDLDKYRKQKEEEDEAAEAERIRQLQIQDGSGE